MPRSTEEILAHADELAKRFEDYEPAPGDDERVSPLTLLRLAALKRAEVEREIAQGVKAARQQEISWRQIGEAVGISAQAAQHRWAGTASA